jgi:quinolinate synthase
MDDEQLIRRVRALLKDRRAILLAHNYQRGEIQDAADITGDSLALSMAAAETDAEVIVFCGVHFMAESAAILSPEKTVLLPRLDAGCPMADMITAADVADIRREHPGVPIVTYVNSSAEVKAASDVCCTSANAVKVTRSVGAERVYLAPDQNLAQWVARHTDQEVLYWKGFCPTHHRLREHHVQEAKARHPGAPFVAHPECRPEVIDLADAVRSTSGIIEYCRASDADTILIGTETGLFHRLQKDSPGKRFVAPSDDLVCPNMKLTTLEDVVDCLEALSNRITVPEDVRLRAKRALDRMLQAGRD